MAVKGAGTYVDGLRNILGNLAQLSSEPDADLQFNVQLQGVITQYIRQRMTATVGAPGGDAAGAEAGGAPGQPGLGPPPAPAGIAPGGGAGMAGMGTPNPDELRRVMAGAAEGGG